jgi:hypothetical protein
MKQRRVGGRKIGVSLNIRPTWLPPPLTVQFELKITTKKQIKRLEKNF